MYKKLSSKTIFKHPRLLVEEDEVALKSGEKIQYLRYGYGGDGVVVIAQNETGQVLFLREYSYVPNKVLLQLPMGKIEDGETIEAAASRELQEETSFKARSLEQLGYYYQNHRRSNNKGYVVMASNLTASQLENEKEEEGIEEVWVSIGELSSLIKNGQIVDADTLSGLRISGL